jgi:hypothetical protein
MNHLDICCRLKKKFHIYRNEVLVLKSFLPLECWDWCGSVHHMNFSGSNLQCRNYRALRYNHDLSVQALVITMDMEEGISA